MGYNKKKEQHVSDFDGYRILKTMNKDRSAYQVEFRSNHPDDEIVDVIKYRKKSGTLLERNVILDTQVNRWTEIYKNEGFEEV